MRRLFILLILACPLTLSALPLPFDLVRDPFEPASSSSPSQNSRSVVAIPIVKLTGIVWDPQDPYAVIVYKGVRKIVTQGDNLDSLRVYVISAKDVTLKSQGRTIVLKIGQEIRL